MKARLSILMLVVPWMSTAYAEVVTWNMVSDFGMRQDDAKPAIDNALVKAREHLAAHDQDHLVLHFPPGTWRIPNPSSPGILIDTLPGGKLTLRGESAEKTTLVFTQFDQPGITIRESDHVTVERMHLTRPVPYTTQGNVVSSARGKVRVRLHEGFPDPVWLASQRSSLRHERVLVPFDGTELDPVPSSVSTKIHFNGVTRAGEGLYDFTINPGGATKRSLALKPGQQVAMKAKTGIWMIHGDGSNHTTIQHVRITRSSRDGIWLRDGNHQIVRAVSIDRGDPINGRLPFFSQPADGIHLWATTSGGGGFLVEENKVVGTADDGIAVFIGGGEERFEEFVKDVVIRNNEVSMGLARSLLLGWTDGAQVHGNRFSSISNIGLLMEGAINSEVWDNVFEDNRQGCAIQVEKTAFTPAKGNRIHRNTFKEVNEDMHLIVLDGAHHATIENNTVASFSKLGGYAPANRSNPAALVHAIRCKSVSGGNRLLQRTAMPLLDAQDSTDVSVAWRADPAAESR
jgi:hypothetical protein